MTVECVTSGKKSDFLRSWEKTGKATAWLVACADLITPVAAYLRLNNMENTKGRYTLLLESVEGGKQRGRYSVIALCPDLVWTCHNGQSHTSYFENGCEIERQKDQEKPLKRLRKLVEDTQITLPQELPPMIGGLFGYLGYDMVRQMETLGTPPPDDLDLPEAVMMRPTLFVVFDSVTDELFICVPSRQHVKKQSSQQAWEDAQNLLEKTVKCLNGPLPTLPLPDKLGDFQNPESTFTRPDFYKIVDKAKEYIRAGDVFQVVPSQRFSTEFPLHPFWLYRSLRRISPAPFLFFLNLGDFCLTGSSPEILARLRDGEVEVRPLAGTRPRGQTQKEDHALAKELSEDPKERSEHLMLIDLGRNDVGRVCEPGSVRVTSAFSIEYFSHVMHLSSTVKGRVLPGKDAIDVLSATFPAGTLTGAPKIRAMQLLDEFEKTRRATYAGCIGYFGANGTMDSCIGLRMAVVKKNKMYVQAGCGIVADSVPQSEYDETCHKAKSVFRAASDAFTMAHQMKQRRSK